MRPIRDIGAIGPSTVLYHSAFGFARVTAVEGTRVSLTWEEQAANLPSRVTSEVLVRVYAECPADGFFARALREPEAITALLAKDGLGALQLILSDLHGPQSIAELREWIAGRRLMSAEAFGHWWKALEPVLQEDERFSLDGDRVALRSQSESEGPKARLENPLLPPGRRLDLVLQHKDELDPEFVGQQIRLAWRTGSAQVRDLALAAVQGQDPNEILQGLLEDGPDSLDAVIHAVRRGGWSPGAVDEYTHHALVERVMTGLDVGGPLDNEGRLAASLLRWPSPQMLRALFEVVSSSDGRRLARATFSALPPRRGEQVALELLELALAAKDADTAQWLGGEALGFALVDEEQMADRIAEEHPALASFYLHTYRATVAKPGIAEWSEDSSDEAYTAEIDLSELVSNPLPLAELPPRSGASLLGLGLSMARAMAVHHKDGILCNPTSRRVLVLPNETMEIVPGGDDPACPRPLMESASPRSDIYAAAVLLLEAMLGRPWPRNLPASRAIPYLRTAIPLIPPSAVAPLDAALHPIPEARPASALEWVALWQASAVAEENRLYASHNAAARLHVGYDSHVGRMKILITQTNQDALFVSTKGPLALMVVCDGISTANAGSGDVASSIAAHVMANLWEQALPRLHNAGLAETREFLDRAMRMANTAVCEAALRFAGGDLEGRVPMGTTVVAAVLHGNHCSLAWLGDSRCYLVGSYGASLLTADENQAGERMKAWHLNFLDSWDPNGFALVGYLGHFDDLQRPEALPAHHASFSLLPGERLVLGSDGITDYIGETHPEVARAISWACAEDDPDEIARALVALANRGGGGDNATCVVAHLWTP